MKFFLFVLFLFQIVSSFLKSESIEALHSRIGDTITLEKRDYFGLFPNIELFKSATLNKNEKNNLFFKIQLLGSDKIINISDSAVSALSDYIENFENYININKKPDVKYKSFLSPDLIAPRVLFRNNVKKIKVKLLNGINYRGYLLYHNDSCIVLSDSIDIKCFKYPFILKVINYNQIDSISRSNFSVIKGKKFIFDRNFEILDDLSMFYQNGEILAPELKKLLNENKISFLDTDTLLYDFDQYYLNNLFIEYESSLQIFNVDKFVVVPRINVFNKYIYPSLDNIIIYSNGFNLGLKIFKPIDVFFGFHFGEYLFQLNSNSSNSLFNNKVLGLQIKSFNLGINYNLWHQHIYRFTEDQFYIDFCFKYYFQKFINNYYILQRSDTFVFDNYDISKTYKQMYQIGLKVGYQINTQIFTNLSGNLNYYDDIGIIYPKEYFTTRYINFFVTYGINLSIGIQF